jgi:ketosteroid isomerase-like protein
VQKSDSPELDEIRRLIRQWADTLASRKLDSHVALYATTVTSFYGETDVSRGGVRAWKQRLFAEEAEIRKFEIHGVQLRRTPEGVVHARFRVRTDAPELGGDYRLQLRPDGSGWKIYAEQRLGSSRS